MSSSAHQGLVLGLCLWLGACGATQGEVVHPKPGEKNTPEYCARSVGQEGNCMACSARPGCGYCEAPLGDAPLCQPGVEGDDAPASCGAKLVLNSTGCDAPPPPAAQ